MREAMFCDHANENPSRCSCDANCYCKEHTCKGSRTAAPEELKTNIGTNINVFSNEVTYVRQDIADERVREARRDEWEAIAQSPLNDLKNLKGVEARAMAKAAHQIITALSTLQGKAAVSERVCECGHLHSRHLAFEDHDECGGCWGRDDPCCHFVAATTPASEEAPSLVLVTTAPKLAQSKLQ